MTEEQLAVAFIEDESLWNGKYLSPKMKVMIGYLFDKSKEPELPELRIARLCSEIMEGIKRVSKAGVTTMSDSMWHISQDVIDSCKQEGRLTRGALLDEYLVQLPDEPCMLTELSEEDHAWALKTMRNLHHFMIGPPPSFMIAKGKPQGVYAYIGWPFPPKQVRIYTGDSIVDLP